MLSIAGDFSGEMIFTNAIRNRRAAGPEIDIAGSVTEGSSIIVGAMSPTRACLRARSLFEASRAAGSDHRGQGGHRLPGDAASVGVGSPSIVTSASKFYDIPSPISAAAPSASRVQLPHHRAGPITTPPSRSRRTSLLVAVARGSSAPSSPTQAQMIVEHLEPAH